MHQIRIRQRAIVLSIVVSWAAFSSIGCEGPQKIEAIQEENLILTERVAELEYQLSQAEAAASAETMSVQAPVVESVYTVVEGDSLWSIAKKQLGSGNRYKDILALNPQISQNVPLAIGTKLKLPPR